MLLLARSSRNSSPKVSGAFCAAESVPSLSFCMFSLAGFASAPRSSLKLSFSGQNLLLLSSAFRKMAGRRGDWSSNSGGTTPPSYRHSPHLPESKSPQSTMDEKDEPCSTNAKHGQHRQTGRRQHQQMSRNMMMGKQDQKGHSSFPGRKTSSAHNSPVTSNFVFVPKRSSSQGIRPSSASVSYADDPSCYGGQCHGQVEQGSLVNFGVSGSCFPPSGNEVSIQDALVNHGTPLVERTEEGNEADSRNRIQIELNSQLASQTCVMHQKDELLSEYKADRNSHQDGQQHVDISGNEIRFGENKLEHHNCVDLFDICPKKAPAPTKLKPSLLSKNKEKRREAERNKMGLQVRTLRSGMILLKAYLTHSEQVEIIKECHQLGLGPGGFYQPGYNDGARLHLHMMCLGKNWDPETSSYGDRRAIDDAKPPSIPDGFKAIVARALQDSHDSIKQSAQVISVEDVLPSMKPDICIVNFYTNTGKLGLHQDKDESKESLDAELPVVSFSIGDDALFLYGDERDVEKAKNVTLKSGDVLIFGGKSRHVFHGVSSISPGTAPKSIIDETGLRPGRLNLTFRQFCMLYDLM